jgi:3-deoxy-7-phosphoheptulonate synthase
MIIDLNRNIRQSDKNDILNHLRTAGIAFRELPEVGGAPRIGLLDLSRVDRERLAALPGVAGLTPVETPFKLASRQMHPADTVIQVGNVAIGGERLTVVAGPCAIESRKQALTVAAEVRKYGAVLFRGGAFKPRTSPYSFQGLEEEGLKILAEIRDTFGMGVITEITSISHADLMMKYIDIVQIGARNMQNFELLKCVGRMGKPVLLKRGLSGTIKEWLMSAEYILSEGNSQVILCERGIRTFEPTTRNTLDLSAIPVMRKLTHLPILIDPSHATGLREKVSPMARAAVAAGADGLMIEVHHDPDNALSDGPQSLYPHQFGQLMRNIYVIAPVVGKQVDFEYLDKADAVERMAPGNGSGRTRAAFMGQMGTFTHKASLQYFGDRVEQVPVPTFKAIFEAVTRGEADFGVIPLENSLTGSIHENYDHLLDYDLKIIGEINLRIMHHLMVKKGTTLKDIRRVLSHPQVFGQCRMFLDQHADWEQVAVSDTANAARSVNQAEGHADAAIANLVAAEEYGLEVIAECIETNPRNFTRFVIIGHKPLESAPAVKSSLICSTGNKPGSLYRVLKVFADNDINIIKLESRPIQGRPWKYMFYMDLEVDLAAEKMSPIREVLEEKTDYLKILGSYCSSLTKEMPPREETGGRGTVTVDDKREGAGSPQGAQRGIAANQKSQSRKHEN